MSKIKASHKRYVLIFERKCLFKCVIGQYLTSICMSTIQHWTVLNLATNKKIFNQSIFEIWDRIVVLLLTVTWPLMGKSICYCFWNNFYELKQLLKRGSLLKFTVLQLFIIFPIQYNNNIGNPNYPKTLNGFYYFIMHLEIVFFSKKLRIYKSNL